MRKRRTRHRAYLSIVGILFFWSMLMVEPCRQNIQNEEKNS